MIYKTLIKPLFDFVIALTGYIILFPVFLVIMIILLIANKGRPFFLQSRPGKNQKIFKVIKFKTMSDQKDKNGNLLSDAKRLTPAGKFIRKTSLDEIPQLLNVIKGDMSLIGPRPLLPEYLPFYNSYHVRRHEVKPGITGLAQTNGRNNMKFSERFNLDVYYVEHLSFSLDVKILFKTFSKLFKSSDIVNGQMVDEVDDLGISRTLSSNHFKIKS